MGAGCAVRFPSSTGWDASERGADGGEACERACERACALVLEAESVGRGPWRLWWTDVIGCGSRWIERRRCGQVVGGGETPRHPVLVRKRYTCTAPTLIGTRVAETESEFKCPER